jgi:hypothetical protein
MTTTFASARQRSQILNGRAVQPAAQLHAPHQPHLGLVNTPVLYTVNQTHPSWTRDGDAHRAIDRSLMGGAIPAGPSVILVPNNPGFSGVLGCRDDWPMIGTNSLLTLACRPPRREDAEGKKRRYFSRTWLEGCFLRGLARIFSQSSRQCIALQPEFARQLPTEWAFLNEVYYRVYDKRVPPGVDRRDHSDYMAVPDKARYPGELRCRPFPHGDLEKTYGYIAFVRSIPQLECPVLAVFGLSGGDTQRLARSLEPEGPLAGLLEAIVTQTHESAHLTIVEMERTGPRKPLNLVRPFCTDYTAKVVFSGSVP